MKKFIAGLIGGVSVLALTLIAVLLAPEIFLQSKWRMLSGSIGLIAVISMVLQGFWIKQDEDAERKDREIEREAQEQERTQLYSALRVVVEAAEYMRKGSGAPFEGTRRAEELLTDLQETPLEVEPRPTGTCGDDGLITAGPRGEMFWDLKRVLRGLIEQGHVKGNKEVEPE